MKPIEGNLALVKYLEAIGISQYWGVNGGGIFNIVKYLSPIQFCNITEYICGYAPIGYYLGSGKVGASIVTTGAAEKIVGCGATDARFLNIPALYILPLNNHTAEAKYPLQDVSPAGMSILKQYQAEFGDSVLLVKNSEHLYEDILHLQNLLTKRRPVFLFFYPDQLTAAVKIKKIPKLKLEKRTATNSYLLLNTLNQLNKTQNTYLYLSSEASISQVNPNIIANLANHICAKVIYSVNGSNSAIKTAHYNQGHILFGGNEQAIKSWRNIQPDDIVICLGIDVEEYVLNLEKLPACNIFCLTNLSNAYGQNKNSYKHLADGSYTQLDGHIESTLTHLLSKLKPIDNSSRLKINSENKFHITTRQDRPEKQFVDIANFYKHINALWRPNSIGFDDICTAYRDRQAVLLQPNPNIKFYSSPQGSAMGSAFGLGVGACLANSKQHCFVFSGDGCSRYFFGCLPETARLGLTVFIFSNQSFGIVKSVLQHILPEFDEKVYHHKLQPINYKQLANSLGWAYEFLKPNLENINMLIHKSYQSTHQSLLIEIPCNANQVIGKNIRIENLSM